MAVTDADQLAEIVWRLVEDPTLASGLWTLTEIAGLFNQRQNRFNRDTYLMLAQIPIAATNGVASYDLPDDWIATQRVTWKSAGGTAISPIDRGDRFSAAALGTVGTTRPILYDDHDAGSRTIELFSTPLVDGTIGLTYASIMEILNFNPANPDIFDIPDDFVPYVMYGVLEDLLSKDGRGRDLQRAAYCRARYEEGVAMAAIFLGGFI